MPKRPVLKPRRGDTPAVPRPTARWFSGGRVKARPCRPCPGAWELTTLPGAGAVARFGRDLGLTPPGYVLLPRSGLIISNGRTAQQKCGERAACKTAAFQHATHGLFELALRVRHLVRTPRAATMSQEGRRSP